MVQRATFQVCNPLSHQIIAAAWYTVIFYGFCGLYATFTYIACIQLNKLKLGLLDIIERKDTSEQNSGAETDHVVGKEQVHRSLEVVRDVHKQLKDCIRHHQQILRYFQPTIAIDGSA
jgi:hypothetical protein